ncbi:hypothetical protein BHE74_00057695, partial [Ensete ventricosum]
MGGTYRSARLPKSTVGGRLTEKSTVGGRLSEKSTVGGRLRKKKGRRRGKGKEKEEGKKEYLASVVLARLPSLPAGRLRTVAARGSLATTTAAAFSPARGDATRGWRPRPPFLPREETDRGD